MDVVGGDHGVLALGAGAVFDPAKDSPLALPEFVEDIGFHSRVSVVWPNEDMRLPPLLPNYRGFSSFPRQMSLQDLYITLGSGLIAMRSGPWPRARIRGPSNRQGSGAVAPNHKASRCRIFQSYQTE